VSTGFFDVMMIFMFAFYEKSPPLWGWASITVSQQIRQ
jgi:hypothetical protein